jgi:hypothetical protein
MTTIQKLTELPTVNTVSSNSLLYVVIDPNGTPASHGISVQKYLESNVSSNLALNGSSVITGVSSANASTIRYSATPANSTAVPAGFANGTVWSDGSYLYVVTGPSALKRVAISTW